MDLAMKWQEILENLFLRDLPFKIELNKYGEILISSASNRHGRVQFKVGSEIERIKRSGYHEKGELEVWIVSEAGKANFYTPTGALKNSKIAADFSL